jgi:hypothetical protein
VGLFEHERNFLSRATAEESPYTLELFEINDLHLCVNTWFHYAQCVKVHNMK